MITQKVKTCIGSIIWHIKMSNTENKFAHITAVGGRRTIIPSKHIIRDIPIHVLESHYIISVAIRCIRGIKGKFYELVGSS